MTLHTFDISHVINLRGGGVTLIPRVEILRPYEWNVSLGDILGILYCDLE